MKVYPVVWDTIPEASAYSSCLFPHARVDQGTLTSRLALT